MRSSLAHTDCTSLEMVAWLPLNIPDLLSYITPELGPGGGYLQVVDNSARSFDLLVWLL